MAPHPVISPVLLPLFVASACFWLHIIGLANSLFQRIKVALRRENVRPWHEVEQDFIECEYRAVRDRQMKELELEDDLLSKIPVRWILSMVDMLFQCSLYL